jgi:hypothetical protein
MKSMLHIGASLGVPARMSSSLLLPSTSAALSCVVYSTKKASELHGSPGPLVIFAMGNVTIHVDVETVSRVTHYWPVTSSNYLCGPIGNFTVQNWAAKADVTCPACLLLMAVATANNVSFYNGGMRQTVLKIIEANNGNELSVSDEEIGNLRSLRPHEGAD